MKQSEQLRIFQLWLAKHRGLFLKVVRSFSRDATDQEDLFQEISLQVWNSVASYNDQVAETTWIYRVSLYSAIAWSRKEKTRNQKRQELVAPEQLVEPSSESMDPRVEWLYEQISKLDPVDRSLALLLLDGFSYREMGETVGMSVNNVGVRISRIKSKLIGNSERGEAR